MCHKLSDRSCLFQLLFVVSGGSTVVEPFTHHLKVKGSSPGAGARWSNGEIKSDVFADVTFYFCLSSFSDEIWRNIIVSPWPVLQFYFRLFSLNWNLLYSGKRASLFVWKNRNPSVGISYKTFYGRNLQIFVISWSACPWQAFPAWSNVCG